MSYRVFDEVRNKIWKGAHCIHQILTPVNPQELQATHMILFCVKGSLRGVHGTVMHEVAISAVGLSLKVPKLRKKR